MAILDDYPELVELLKGSSLNQIGELLYRLYQLRYATKDQLNYFNNKLATPKKLKKLVDLEYLKTTNTDYFFTGKFSISQGKR